MLALHGPRPHELFDATFAQADLVITSYALIRRDAERYRDFEFDTVVLDEAQHIKNRQTQNAQAVKAVRAQHRLVLTGTPLENSCSISGRIFDFLMPGYLGTAQDFRERYELPITREKDASAQARLARRLRPFMLRRLKRDVAADLPGEARAGLLLRTHRRSAERLPAGPRGQPQGGPGCVGAQGLRKSRMVVLTALLRLRQVCCDLRLLKLDGRRPPPTPPARLRLFGELLEEVIDGGHRVLVFSQFVSMLTLLRERLDGARKSSIATSTARPRDRGASRRAIPETTRRSRCSSSASRPAASASTSPAPTPSSTSIPWWNPAVEDQATDRAHRIGQTRVVTSYKLITRDTVEEKILALQKRKREIIQATLGGEEALAEALTWEEIQELFST